MSAPKPAWTRCPAPRNAPKVRLFCFPFAGGSASTYRGWDLSLPPTVEVHVVDLPGRIPRLAEAPRTDIKSLADECAAALPAKIQDLPYAFFGHSMGAVVAFETAARLAAQGKSPTHFFASARQSPSLPWRRQKIHALPEAEFSAALARLGGTSRLVLADPEMMQIVMPSLRADFTAIETYQYRAGLKLDCNVSVIGGTEDPDVTQTDLLAWQDVTTRMALVELHPGGHFYIDQQLPNVINRIITELRHAGVL